MSIRTRRLAEAGSYDQLVRSLSALLVGCSMLDYSVWDLAVCTARMQKKTGVCCGNFTTCSLPAMLAMSSVSVCLQSVAAVCTMQVLLGVM